MPTESKTAPKQEIGDALGMIETAVWSDDRSRRRDAEDGERRARQLAES
jgi:hypothetical protein